MLYKLGGDGQTPVKEDDILAWAVWYEEADRHVADTIINERIGWDPSEGGERPSAEFLQGVAGRADAPTRVSTVFTGIDSNLTGVGPPTLFETMIFGGALDGEMIRTATWEDAMSTHNDVVSAIRDREPAFYGIKPGPDTKHDHQDKKPLDPALFITRKIIIEKEK